MRLILAFILITFISCSEPTSSTTSETENVIWAFNGSTSVPAAKITILNLNVWVEATQTSTVFSEFETSDTGHVDLGLLPNGRYSGFIEDDSLGLYFVFDVVDSLILDVDSLILEPYNTYEIHMPSQANSTIHLLGTPYEIQLNSEGAAYQQKIPMGHYPTAIYQGETLYIKYNESKIKIYGLFDAIIHRANLDDTGDIGADYNLQQYNDNMSSKSILAKLT